MDYPITPATRVRRLPKRGVYDREAVHAILDEGLLCHVGLVAEGRPVVIPTLYSRSGETLYIHGSAASRMLRTMSEGVDVCVTVSLLDGLVLAKSAFHHSVNYRSVVVFGKARLVEEPEEKRRALEEFVEHVIPGRSAEARGPNEVEMRATWVLALDLEEVSAKVRTGGPVDDEEDLSLPVWRGVLPLTLTPGEPISEDEGAEPPDYVKRWSRGRKK